MQSLLRAPMPATTGLALGRKGFRPFFLLAAAFAATIVPHWLLVRAGVVAPSGYYEAAAWHAHEMVFGFTVAVIAGFLLTAVGNWTQSETSTGAPLLALAALWAAGRLAITLGGALPRVVPAALDLAFLPALAAVLARPLLRARNRRNYVMLGVLAALWLADVATHLGAWGVAPDWQRRGALVAVDVVVALVVVLTARIVPSFTRNATRDERVRSLPRVDALAAASVVGVALVDAVVPFGRVAGVVSLVAGVLVAARSARWGTLRTFRDPLLWILHAGCAWVSVGLVLRGLSCLVGTPPASLATHALTVGAIGSLTLGMMARVALGHTGRLLEAPRAARVAFVALTASALVRVVGPWVAPAWTDALLVVAGALFASAFVLYLAGYARALLAPRVDGKPG